MNNDPDLTPRSEIGLKTAGITVTPEARLESIKNMLPGTHFAFAVIIQNTGDTDTHYFITAKWFPPGNVEIKQVLILADLLSVTIRAGVEGDNPSVLYEGPLINLKKVPRQGRSLTAEKNSESVEFDFYLPENTPNLVYDLDIKAEFEFESEQDL